MNWNDASTSCDNAREAIADALLSPRGAALGADVERHVAECAACRAYRTECEAMWTSLAQLRTPAPASGASARFMAALRRETSGPGFRPVPPGPLPVRRFLAIAASLIVAAFIGFGAGSVRNRSAPPTRVTASADAVPQFLLLLYDPSTPGPELAPDRIAGIIAEYTAWARGLETAGQLVSAEKLSDNPSDWLGGAVETRGGERIGGFFLIRARDVGEARRIAQQCPHLKYGGRIELRPIQPTGSRG